ncbi:hemin ABC transporter substrate-binding protein [Izhakiella australiensis]|uniref:Hemin ABC transporter substrate-binding protein n=1 Tax=Izhakiella australiensis TaxID=1926881 RepID=A0A1S8YTK0_9GAMM|nr:hemin ABC transporter substrate-binding protein [Izhakiella australiensis]
MLRTILGLLMLCCAVNSHAAERLVVAGGSLVELVYALGAGSSVVAVDQTTTFPPQTVRLPHISNWQQLSSEGILSLRPDCFITWQDAGPPLVLKQLRAKGVSILALPRVPATVEQLYANIRQLAQRLHRVASGEALISRIRHKLTRAIDGSRRHTTPLRGIFILAPGGGAPMVAGQGSVADAILQLAGVRNLAQHWQYKRYSAEALAAANPDVIIVTREMYQGGLARLRAIGGITYTAAWRHKRIVVIDQSLILGMGPRVADAVHILHRQLWPGQKDLEN